jgi:hypothetical protein
VGVVTEKIQSRVPRAEPLPYVKRWGTPDLTHLRSSITAASDAITILRRRGEALDKAQEQFSMAKRHFCREMVTQKKNH